MRTLRYMLYLTCLVYSASKMIVSDIFRFNRSTLQNSLQGASRRKLYVNRHGYLRSPWNASLIARNAHSCRTLKNHLRRCQLSYQKHPHFLVNLKNKSGVRKAFDLPQLALARGMEERRSFTLCTRNNKLQCPSR